MVRDGEQRASVHYEAEDVVPETDFRLYYQLSGEEFGLAMLTHRPPGEDGFFLLMLRPKVEYTPEEIAPKDLTLVVDTSGSMLGPKMDQAKKAIHYCLDHLNPGDRFRIVRFSTDVEAHADRLQEATPENLAAAREFVTGIHARGGTNIVDALDVQRPDTLHYERARVVCAWFLHSDLHCSTNKQMHSAEAGGGAALFGSYPSRVR